MNYIYFSIILSIGEILTSFCFNAESPNNRNATVSTIPIAPVKKLMIPVILLNKMVPTNGMVYKLTLMMPNPLLSQLIRSGINPSAQVATEKTTINATAFTTFFLNHASSSLSSTYPATRNSNK